MGAGRSMSAFISNGVRLSMRRSRQHQIGYWKRVIEGSIVEDAGREMSEHTNMAMLIIASLTISLCVGLALAEHHILTGRTGLNPFWICFWASELPALLLLTVLLVARRRASFRWKEPFIYGLAILQLALPALML